MDSSKIKALIIVVLALCFALYLGITAATAQLEALIWVGGGIFITTCFLLGRHIWILIPATLGMRGGLNFIPGSPAPWQLMTAVVGVFFLLRWLTRVQKIHLRWSGMETAIFLVALTILQAFLRNPTGLSILGGDVAGGKPYFVFGVAMIAYFLISTAESDIKTWRWAVIAYIFFALVDASISALSGLSPAFASFMIRFYSNVSFIATQSEDYTGDALESRITEFGTLGSILGLVACSFWRPLAALDPRKPYRIVIALAAVVLTLLGGFRGNAVLLFTHFSLGSILRRKFLDVFVVSIAGALLLGGVLVAVPTAKLPYSVQRILTILPGVQVESQIAQDAENSSELRFEMWKLVLTTDRYISNKLLGDGFQFSASEMAAREARMFGDYRMTGGMTTEEHFLVTGSYHGFHAETIRFTGVIGLIAATAALIVFAVFAHRCIKYYRGEREWGTVLFLCMPFLIHPLWYWLIFGAYRNDFPTLIATVGMVKLLTRIQLQDEFIGTQPTP
jgi:hypothetical protein